MTTYTELQLRREEKRRNYSVFSALLFMLDLDNDPSGEVSAPAVALNVEPATGTYMDEQEAYERLAQLASAHFIVDRHTQNGVHMLSVTRLGLSRARDYVQSLTK